MRPDEFLEVADKLRAIDTSAALRSAVSRAYYAVFHAATVAQLKLGARRTRSHDVLGSRLQASPDAAVRLLGDRFLSLKARRVESDYRIGSPTEVEHPATVGALVDEARELLSMLADLPTSERANAAAVGIRIFDGLGRTA